MKLCNRLRTLKRLYRFVHDQYNARSYERKREEIFRLSNANNFATIHTNLRDDRIDRCIHIGDYSYGDLNVLSFSETDKCGLYIGRFCSIAQGNTFLLDGGHDYLRPTTYPFKYFFLNQQEATSKGPIILEDDVWLGENVTVLSGVTLCRGTVVAAGSIVTSSSKPYSIIGGVPAKFIKYRFAMPIVEKLSSIDYSCLTPEKIIDNINLLYEEVTEENVDKIVSFINSNNVINHI